MGGFGSGRKGREAREAREALRPAYAPPLYRPQVQVPPKPLEYQLVDLLGAENIGDVEREAIRVVLFFVASVRRGETRTQTEVELATLREDYDRVAAHESRYRNALMGISNTEGAAGEIALAALSPAPEPCSCMAHGETKPDRDCQICGGSGLDASAIETRSAGTVEQGPARQGESATAESRDAQTPPV